MSEPELTDAEKQAFRDIANGLSDDAANRLLNHHVGKTRRWLRWCAGNGYTPSITDLMRQIHDLRLDRKHMTAALSVALWRLAHRKEEDLRDERRRDNEAG